MWKFINLLILCSLLLLVTPSHSAVMQDEKKNAYGLLVDNTVSLKKRFPDVKLVSYTVATRLHKRGPMVLMNFKLDPDTEFLGIYDGNDAHEGRNSERATGTVGVDWTENENTIGKYLETLPLARGNTDLLSAVQSLAEALNAKAKTEQGALKDKVIVLITDGEHRMPTHGGPDEENDERRRQERELIKKLKESGIKVFAVGFLEDLNPYSGRYRVTTRDRAEGFLKRITKDTGGRAIFATSKKFDADTIVTQLLAE